MAKSRGKKIDILFSITLLFLCSILISSIAYAESAQSSNDVYTGTGAGTVYNMSGSAQPASVPSEWEDALATCPFDKDGVAVSATNAIVNEWNNNGITATALETTQCTPSAVLNYWRHDYNLKYYNNLGDSDPQNSCGTDCSYLEFNDGNMGVSKVSASQIQSLNPSRGLAGTDEFVNSCYSHNQPMLGAFTSHNPNWYIGGTTSLPVISSTSVDQTFWSYYIGENGGEGSPAIALYDACYEYGLPSTDYGQWGG